MGEVSRGVSHMLVGMLIGSADLIHNLQLFTYGSRTNHMLKIGSNLWPNENTSILIDWK